MRRNLHDLNLIDLISEKHLALRKKVTDMDINDMNKTETHILAIIEDYEVLSISEISRIINISRQGTHKSIQGLLTGGYVKVIDVKDNQRDRYISLTSKGLQCNKDMLMIKMDLEQQILNVLGSEKVAFIKSILREEWL